MVIPWAGFSLSKLLDRVQPLSDAKFVAFETLVDPKRMTNRSSQACCRGRMLKGLRMDEAMHPLTLLASGLYVTRQLPPQDGAPIRLVVPWKYGFKGIKSIVKIDLRAATAADNMEQFRGTDEYGFYSNVNPHVDHPRWSQATELSIGEFAAAARIRLCSTDTPSRSPGCTRGWICEPTSNARPTIRQTRPLRQQRRSAGDARLGCPAR